MHEYNHGLFVMQFESLLGEYGFYLTKPFNEDSKGDRFYRKDNTKKAIGRYRFICASKSKSGYPAVMWHIFDEVNKEGKLVSAGSTNYFWFKPEVQKGDQPKKVEFNEEEYKKRQKEREEEQLRLQKEWRLQAHAEYFQLRDHEADVVTHEYLVRKRIKALRGVVLAKQSLRLGSYYNQFKATEADKVYYYIGRGDLLIPAINIDKEFVTYQKITADGTKRQRIDISTVGAFYLMGQLTEDTETVYLCEGYATGYSLFEAAGQTVLVCFDVNNVGFVAQQLKARYPNLSMVFSTDNDRKKVTKVGIYKGFEYAYRFDMPFVFPCFANNDENDGRSDWNDLAEISTPVEIREMLEKQIDYFKKYGKQIGIAAACAAYGVSIQDLELYAQGQITKHPDLFKTVITKLNRLKNTTEA